LGNLGGQYGEALAISGAGVIAGLIYWKLLAVWGTGQKKTNFSRPPYLGFEAGR